MMIHCAIWYRVVSASFIADKSPVLLGSLLHGHHHLVALIQQGLLRLLMGPSGHGLAGILADEAQGVTLVQSNLKIEHTSSMICRTLAKTAKDACPS